MSFETEIPVRFAHVDAAGIVFYPRYFEMLNQVVEEWFERELGTSFRDLHVDGSHGVPAVRVETDFLRPSRLGDRLVFSLDVVALGRSRIELRVVATLGGEERVRVKLVLAYVSLSPMQSCAIPDALRARMEIFLVPEPEPS
ncbi:MAG: thioesterase superfamily protein [Rhodospirillales bacterium]|nr:thioesterase superfamily protein [Rhodospirillales bacterium]